MKQITTCASAAILALSMVALTGCGQAEGRDVQAGPVTATVPEEWVDPPDTHLYGFWQAGAIDAEGDDATTSVRLKTELESGPYASAVLTEMTVRANFEGMYGSSFTQGETTDLDIRGADEAQEMRFEYVGSESGITMIGRFWSMADRSNGNTALVEFVTVEDGGLSDEQIEQIRDSITFDPSVEG